MKDLGFCPDIWRILISFRKKRSENKYGSTKNVQFLKDQNQVNGSLLEPKKINHKKKNLGSRKGSKSSLYSNNMEESISSHSEHPTLVNLALKLISSPLYRSLINPFRTQSRSQCWKVITVRGKSQTQTSKNPSLTVLVSMNLRLRR